MLRKPKLLIASALIIIVAFATIYTVWQIQSNQGAPVDRNVLFQVAAFNTFSDGNYAGIMNYSVLEQHGDFGIGTFDGLDGEMLAVDGQFYQIPSDGIPQLVSPNQTAPYATVTYFKVDKTVMVSDVNYTQLRAFLDRQLPSLGAIYAIKVTGTFNYAQTRSPQKQVEPYPNITEALLTQSVFNLTNVSATAVGFWFPSSMNGVDYAGYHLHLITSDHTAGGHLLDCIIANATVELDQINDYNLILP